MSYDQLPGSGGGGSSAGPGTNFPGSSFVFRPGGTASANVYTDWNLLYTDLIKSSGYRNILFDDSGGTQTIDIPAGSYNMIGVTFNVTPDGPTINLDDGCVFTGAFPIIDGDMTLNSNSNSIVFTAPANAICFMTITNVATIQASGTAPIVDVSAGATLALLLSTNGAVGLANYEVFQIELGAIALVLGGTGSTVANNSFRGAGTVEFITNSDSAALSPTQNNVTGTLINSLQTEAAFVGYSDTYQLGLPGDTQTYGDYAILSTLTLRRAYEYVSMTTGGSHTASNNLASVLLHGSTTVSTFTAVSPAIPLDGQRWAVSTDQTITNLIVSFSTGTAVGTPPITLTQGGHFAYLYNLANTKWWPE